MSRITSRKRSHKRDTVLRASRGFTLIEMVITLLLAVGLFLGIMMVFQVNTNVAKLQMQVAGLQQASRIGQHDLVKNVRMVGRGGLPHMLRPSTIVAPQFPGRILPAGVALEVRNNVPDNSVVGANDSPAVLEGTDVLTIRGVFTAPVYQVDVANYDPAIGRVTVNFLSPSGVPQDLDPLAEAIDAALGGQPEAIVVVSPLGPSLYGVVELVGGGSVTGTSDGEEVTLQANLQFASTGATHADDFRGLAPEGRLSPQITSVAFIGILEEYRYYIRERRAIDGDPTSELIPELARSRFYPLTDVPHPDPATTEEMIADNIVDLQVALGIDTDRDGLLFEGADTTARDTDEWMLNSPGDVLDDPNDDPLTWVWNQPDIPVSYLRVTTLARSDRRDTRYIAPPIEAVEDRVYDEDEIPGTEAERLERTFRRRMLQTMVDLRNLG